MSPWQRLAHDVGKYVARAARNLPASAPVPAVLVGMLVDDLFALRDGQPASAVFAELRAELEERGEEPRLDAVEAHLVAIDALEEAVRRGEDGAVRAAAEHACAVEAELRALAEARA